MRTHSLDTAGTEQFSKPCFFPFTAAHFADPRTLAAMRYSRPPLPPSHLPPSRNEDKKVNL